MKRDVQRLQEDNTYVRAANFKNSRIQIENESKMEACIKSLELEIEDLKTLLEKYEELKSENKVLNSRLQSTEQENNDATEKYKNEIETLKSRIDIGFKCEDCEHHCEDRKTLKEHILLKHNRNRLKCDQCDKRIDTKTSMRTHILTNHDGRKYKCKVCDKVFSTNTDLKEHMNAQHND